MFYTNTRSRSSRLFTSDAGAIVGDDLVDLPGEVDQPLARVLVALETLPRHLLRCALEAEHHPAHAHVPDHRRTERVAATPHAPLQLPQDDERAPLPLP